MKFIPKLHEIFTIFMCFALPACAGNKDHRNLPLSIPFEIYKKNQADLNFRIADDEKYSFNLHFKFDEKNRSTRNTVELLMGDFGAREGDSENKGEPIEISLAIFRIDSNGQNLIAEVKTKYIASYSIGADHYEKELYRLNLAPGMYMVSIKSLVDMPAFTNIKTEFTITHAHIGK